MKRNIIIGLLFICAMAYTQNGTLPQAVESALKEKYPVTKFEGWWAEDDTYYIEFNYKGHSYTSAFGQDGTWKETAETISEMDIPQSLKEYIRDAFPSGKISYCEEVETGDMKKYLRVNLFDSSNILRVIWCDPDGLNIRIQESDP
jgi:hypothetical protein